MSIPPTHFLQRGFAMLHVGASTTTPVPSSCRHYIIAHPESFRPRMHLHGPLPHRLKLLVTYNYFFSEVGDFRPTRNRWQKRLHCLCKLRYIPTAEYFSYYPTRARLHGEALSCAHSFVWCSQSQLCGAARCRNPSFQRIVDTCAASPIVPQLVCAIPCSLLCAPTDSR